MAIKKLIFTLQQASSLMYTAFGGVRFYDKNETMIDSGAEISSNGVDGETENFITTATSVYATASYHMPNPFNSNKSQNGSYSSESYWLTDSTSSPQILTVEFKTVVTDINRIEFVPRPDSQSDRGIDADFTIEAQDESGSTIHTYTVTPIATNQTIQSLDTPLFSSSYRMLISNVNGDIFSIKKNELKDENAVTLMSSDERAIANASSTFDTYFPYRAFDGVINTNTCWISDGFSSSGEWISYNFNEPIRIEKYEINPRVYDPTNESPIDWTFEGSNDSSNWDILDTQTGVTDWVANETKSFTFTNSNKYQYYRLNASSVGGTRVAIGELFMYEQIAGHFRVLLSQTEQDFINHGMDYLTIDLTEKYTIKQYIMPHNQLLGSGHKYSKQINMKNPKVNKIRFK